MAVKSFKHHLYTTVGNRAFTFEELYTILVRIEAILNSRPLTTPTSDPGDLTVITPGHLISGEQIVRPLGPGIEELSPSDLVAWDRIRRVEQAFWDRWQDEYLLSLQKRTKWTNREENVKVGDLVIIKDDDMPPGHWKKGRITEVFPGADNCVRSVSVKTASSEFIRPITKLVLLPVETGEGDNKKDA